MLRFARHFSLSLLTLLFLATPLVASEIPQPLNNAHAHNDYWHDRPLLDALSYGFMSVEADILLIDGKLLVGHEKSETSPEKTLTRLYLDPLAEQVQKNGGQVYGDKQTQPFQLMIDLKTKGDKTYPVLVERLKTYQHMLSRFEDGKVTEGAVKIVITGSRPREIMQAENPRFAFHDMRYVEKDKGYKASFASLTGEKWSKFFSWYGLGEMPERERAMLETYVKAAHERGQKVRFYATPDFPSKGRDRFWQTLLDVGVDYINTDDLKGLHDFLKYRRK